jgi:hypothetical protein
MSRKVYLELKIKVVLDVEDTATVTEVIENRDYVFIPQEDEASVVDTEIRDWKITDSK